MQKPTKPCYVCGGNDWWQLPDGSWRCGRCHPQPAPENVPELAALIDRVRKGNDKLWEAWKVIRDVENPEEKDALFRKWDAKKEFLNDLCKELVFKGYRDCLYIENGKKTKRCLDEPGEWFCNTCPSQREYWVEEVGFK